MRYQVIYTHRAERDLDKLDNILRKRIGEKILKMADNPFLYAERLSEPQIGSYRFRIGDYRVIFDIYENFLIILRIGHRKEIYRR